jgi:hypothetical protein
VQRAGDQLLARTAFAANEHGDVRIGHALDEILHFGHALAVAEEHRVARLVAKLFAQRGDFLGELPLLQRVADHHFELGVLERLADEVGCAQLHRLDDRIRAALARDHDHRDVPVDLPEGGQRGQPVHPSRHHDIQQDGCRPLGMESPHSFVCARDRQRAVAARAEKRPQESAHRQVVVDYHDLLFVIHCSHSFTATGAARLPVEQSKCHKGKMLEEKGNGGLLGNCRELEG